MTKYEDLKFAYELDMDTINDLVQYHRDAVVMGTMHRHDKVLYHLDMLVEVLSVRYHRNNNSINQRHMNEMSGILKSLHE
jgi:hypothetical protein